MKWIELIRVRSSQAVLQAALPALEAHIAAIDDSVGAEVMVLRHALFGGDLALALVWRSGDPPRQTREGLLLADRLRQLGTVDHAVWLSPSHPQTTHP